MTWVIVSAAAILVWAWISARLVDNPRADPASGFLWIVGRWYALLMHRLEFSGAEHVPKERSAGPLIVVVNHASGVDPVLVQMVCPFEIRWIMARDMQHPWGRWFWEWARVIFVDREHDREIGGVREAIRHLRAGGVVGIFPEGAIERPPRRIKPFLAGLGLLIRRTGVPVLPFVIEGTPAVEAAWHALRTPSRARLRALARVSYAGSSLSAQAISDDLHARYLAWTGWE